MTEGLQTKTVYPDGIDESKIGELLQKLLDGIDRDKLYNDKKLIRVRHPLLQERMGPGIALNVEIHNLLTDIVMGLTVSDRISNSAQLRERAKEIEQTLLGAAQDPESFQVALNSLKNISLQIAELNGGDANDFISHDIVSDGLRGRLEMPNTVQELILYPPVTVDSLGMTKMEVLKTLEGCKKMVLDSLGNSDDLESVAIRNQVEDEVAAALAWFEK